MKKPHVTLENYVQVYDHYLDYYPNRLANHVGHAAMALVYKPAVQYADGADEAIRDLLQDNVRLILASNHVNDQDQYVVATMAQQEAVLRPMRGKTFIPAKESLFRQRTISQRLLRWGVDTMGAIPAFRKKDVAQLGGDEQVVRIRQSAATEVMLDVSAERIARGDHMAIFPEGTRNTVDPRRVQEVKPGLGRIVCKLDDALDVTIVPMGIYYGEGVGYNQKRPTVFVGHPFEATRDAEALSVFTRVDLQECVDQAVITRLQG